MNVTYDTIFSGATRMNNCTLVCVDHLRLPKTIYGVMLLFVFLINFFSERRVVCAGLYETKFLYNIVHLLSLKYVANTLFATAEVDFVL